MLTNNKVGNAFMQAQPKDNKFRNELKIFAAYLKGNVVTCSMASEALHIPQKNLCRYKRTLQKADLLWVTKKAHCKITGFIAQWLTTDARRKPRNPQIQLFSHEK